MFYTVIFLNIKKSRSLYHNNPKNKQKDIIVITLNNHFLTSIHQLLQIP